MKTSYPQKKVHNKRKVKSYYYNIDPDTNIEPEIEQELKGEHSIMDLRKEQEIYYEEVHRNNVSEQRETYHSNNGYQNGISVFESRVTPLIQLKGSYSDADGSVSFKMRRKNKTVTLQWESFSGYLAYSGTGYLEVSQSIANVPPYPMRFPIFIEYKGVAKMSYLLIDPFEKSKMIRFYLTTDQVEVANHNVGDYITVHASAVHWVLE